MKKADPSDNINKLWNGELSEEQMRSFSDSIRKNKKADQDIFKEDPASLLFLYGNEVRRAVDAADLDDSLKLPETVKTIKHPADSHFHPVKSIAAVFASFFPVRWMRTVSAATMLILLGAIFYLSFIYNEDSGPESASGQGLQKIQKYDNGIGRKASAAVEDYMGEKIETADSVEAGVARSAIATNLVTDGRKVIHYKLDSGTEMIFITGLD